jgi:hypothetical protein
VHTWWPPSVPIALQEQEIDRHHLARRPMTQSPAGERPILGQLGQSGPSLCDGVHRQLVVALLLIVSPP